MEAIHFQPFLLLLIFNPVCIRALVLKRGEGHIFYDHFDFVFLICTTDLDT